MQKKQVSLLPMNEIVFESARISFVEGILIAIGVLWMLGFLRTKIYVPVVVKEIKSNPENEKEVVVKDENKTIYREKKNKDESYTDFEEIKS